MRININNTTNNLGSDVGRQVRFLRNADDATLIQAAKGAASQLSEQGATVLATIISDLAFRLSESTQEGK